MHGYNDLAIVLADQMRLHEALAVLDLAASLDPNDADARHHRAFALLQGRLREGWAAYAARFDTRQGRPDRRGFAQPLWELAGWAWVSLQVSPRAADLGTAPAGRIHDIAPALRGFDDTAAAIAHFDAVVICDTSVAHVTSALGKPTFVMLPFAPDWRWMRQGARSLWYPTVTLVRQDADRGWAPVVRCVAAALAALDATCRRPAG